MPIKIVIEFPTEEDRDEFLGQVSDGAMENLCEIEPMNPKKQGDEGFTWAFGGATEFQIKMLPRDQWF